MIRRLRRMKEYMMQPLLLSNTCNGSAGIGNSDKNVVCCCMFAATLILVAPPAAGSIEWAWRVSLKFSIQNFLFK